MNIDSADGKLQVRNLLIISGRPDEGVLSTTVTTEVPDVAVSGSAIRADASTTPLTARLPQPVPIQPYQPKRSDRALVDHRAQRRTPGGAHRRLVLQFQQAGELRIIAPVKSQDRPEYRTIEPPPSNTSTAVDTAG